MDWDSSWEQKEKWLFGKEQESKRSKLPILTGYKLPSKYTYKTKNITNAMKCKSAKSREPR